jgi:NADPH:quinone reductase-like Zn-dependent oxidoreductase
VLFKVTAFALNRADVLYKVSTQPNLFFPSRIGSEATGEVVQIGDKVTHLKLE